MPLAGILGTDWGVIVNPASSQFGRVVFEHADCGCPEANDGIRWSMDEDADAWWDRSDAWAREG